MSSIPLNELVSLISASRLSAYFDVSALALLFYDYLTTFSDEVNLMWRTPWGLSRVLFVLARYSPWIDALLYNSLHFINSDALSPAKAFIPCSQLYQIASWFLLLGSYLAEVIFVFRTYAIWGGGKKILLGLSVIAVLVGAPTAYLTYKGISTIFFVISNATCILVVNAPANRAIAWDFAIVVLLETTILFFTIIPALRKLELRQTNLGATLFKDGLIYYVCLTAFSIGNLIFLGVPNLTQSGVTFILIYRVMHSILPARVLLHIRRAGAKDFQAPLHNDTESWNGFAFSSVMISEDTRERWSEC